LHVSASVLFSFKVLMTGTSSSSALLVLKSLPFLDCFFPKLRKIRFNIALDQLARMGLEAMRTICIDDLFPTIRFSFKDAQ
jgi:hypothetical protein